VTKPRESTPPVGKSPPAAAPAHVSSPAGRKAHVAPSVRAVPTKAMAVGMLEAMVAGMRARSGGGGDDGGGGGGSGGGEGGGSEGGGARQVETVPSTPVRVVAQEQAVAPQQLST
jgi:hypothetical protein